MVTSSFFDCPEFNQRLFCPHRDDSPGPAGTVDFLVSVKGAKLHVRLYPSMEAPLTVLLFHGNGEVVSDYDDLALPMAQCGASLAVVDYRGYGRSTGSPTLRSLVEDARPVVEALRQHISTPVVVYGRSLGCVPVAELARNPPAGVCAMVWDSGILSLEGLVERRGLPVPTAFGQEDLAVFDALPKLATCQLPLLVLHGEEDSHISPLEAQQAFEAAGSPSKQIRLLPGCDHNDVFMSEDYWEALAAFMKSLKVQSERNYGKLC